jgi:hypothetical protein
VKSLRSLVGRLLCSFFRNQSAAVTSYNKLNEENSEIIESLDKILTMNKNIKKKINKNIKRPTKII